MQSVVAARCCCEYCLACRLGRLVRAWQATATLRMGWPFSTFDQQTARRRWDVKDMTADTYVERTALVVDSREAEDGNVSTLLASRVAAGLCIVGCELAVAVVHSVCAVEPAEQRAGWASSRSAEKQ